MFPQVGVGGTTPRPRNESVASNTIGAGESKGEYKRGGATRFGRMSRNTIHRSVAPSDRAASTNSFSRRDSVWPRMIRPTTAQLKKAITAIVTGRLGATIET